MKSRRTSCCTPSVEAQAVPARRRRSERAFTLAEVLAALLFMTIVIPAAVQGVRIAGMAGEMAARKEVAARIAERVLNELIVTGQFLQSSSRGTVQEGILEYQWDMRLDAWIEGNLRLMTVRVKYPVQGQEHEVRLSTLVDTTTQ
jgi:type II secretory pathway pseudopilin PulG